MERIGLDADSRGQSGHSLFTLEAHINYLHEVKLGTEVWVQTQIIGSIASACTCTTACTGPGSTKALAASEQMLLHVDLAGPTSAPFSEQSAGLLQGRGQQRTAAGRFVGRVIGLRKKIAPESREHPGPRASNIHCA
jgi:acyl-CoA thioester hydrolase